MEKFGAIVETDETLILFHRLTFGGVWWNALVELCDAEIETLG